MLHLCIKFKNSQDFIINLMITILGKIVDNQRTEFLKMRQFDWQVSIPTNQIVLDMFLISCSNPQHHKTIRIKRDTKKMH